MSDKGDVRDKLTFLFLARISRVSRFLVFLFAASWLLICDFWDQRVFAAAKDGAVAVPGVSVEFLQVLHQFCP